VRNNNTLIEETGGGRSVMLDYNRKERSLYLSLNSKSVLLAYKTPESKNCKCFGCTENGIGIYNLQIED
jgi:hypothetical protein